MNPITIARRYIVLADEWVPNRNWGDWGACYGSWGVRGQNDSVERPKGIKGLLIQPIVMIELSRYGQTWITIHATPEAAAKAWQANDCIEDWTIALIIDLRDESKYDVEMVAKVVKR